MHFFNVLVGVELGQTVMEVQPVVFHGAGDAAIAPVDDTIAAPREPLRQQPHHQPVRTQAMHQDDDFLAPFHRESPLTFLPCLLMQIQSRMCPTVELPGELYHSLLNC